MRSIMTCYLVNGLQRACNGPGGLRERTTSSIREFAQSLAYGNACASCAANLARSYRREELNRLVAAEKSEMAKSPSRRFV